MLERDFTEHLDEAAIAVVGEPRIAGLLRESFRCFVVQAKVQDSVHHARHGELGAGTNAEQQRLAGIAQLLAEFGFYLGQGLPDLVVYFHRNLPVVVEVDVADFGGHREAGGHGQFRIAHLGEVGALAAERVFHVLITLGSVSAERVNVFLTH